MTTIPLTTNIPTTVANTPSQPLSDLVETALGERQALTAAGAISTTSKYTSLVGPASSTYAVTLAAPTAEQEGRVKVIEMLSTTGSNAVTLALTNVVGGSAASTATFNAAGETLVLVASSGKWVVIKEVGVTLS